MVKSGIKWIYVDPGVKEDQVFRGLYEHTLDPKGRLSLPGEFRGQVATSAEEGERFMITTGLDPCLVVYPISAWAAFETRLASLSQFDPAVVQLKRLYVAGATECSLDKHGRFMIPPLLREHAALEREVVWAGMVTTAELWSKQGWLEHAAQARGDRERIAHALTELGL